MIRNRLVISFAVAVFLVLAGTVSGNAYWSTQGSASSSVRAGTVGISQSGFSNLAVAYTTSVLADTAAVTVQNSGTVSAPFSLALGAQTANNLARAVDVWVWPVSAASACTQTATAGGVQTDWTTVPVKTGTLAPSASQIFCVRSSVTTADVSANQNGSMVATLALSSAIGSWTSTASASATQTAPDVTVPTTPGAPVVGQRSGYSASLTWPAATDNVGVTGYDIYRNGVYLATVSTPAYLDQTLTQGTTYTYTVRAKDAAGQVSPASPATGVTALPIVPTTWYRVTGQGSGLCIDGNGAGTTDGTPLIIWGCHGGTNQGWKFVPTTGGFYKVVAQNAQNSAWSIANDGGTTDGARALLWNYLGGANQQWRIVEQSAGVYKFIAQSSSKCLDVQNNQTAGGTPLQQFTCATTTAQSFTLAGN